jgi:F420-non-reducing hydrogenase large subunit
MKVSIDPITRLEGHGKIEIFLDDDGNVDRAYMQTPELRGFEEFCRGRKAEDMPIITARICGVCPEAHHTAAAKALDRAFNAEPPETAHLLRELLYNAYYFYDHCLHLYYLGGIDVLMGDVPKAERNVIGLIKKFGLEIGREVIKHRRYAMEVVKTLGGREIHPVAAIPGGVSNPLTEEGRQKIEEKAGACIDFAVTTMGIFKEIFGSKRWNDLLGLDAVETYYMGLVDKNNNANYYDGDVRVVGPDGTEFSRIRPDDFFDHVEETVEEWTYVKFPYLKSVGWNGFTDGPKSGIFRVGPLGRMNAADGVNTKRAMQEFKEFKHNGPVHETFGYYQARLIEMLNAAERLYDLSQHPKITDGDIRTMPGEPGEGIGIVEAARGTLIHRYKLDKKGLIDTANLIVATTNNNAAINMSVANAARKVIHNGKVDDIILNKVESAFRCYDPCLACASHALGETPLVTDIYWKGRLHKRLAKHA